MQSLEQRVNSKQIALVLLNMGGPKDLDSIRPFLYNLFADSDIINLPTLLRPFQKQLAWLIAKYRTKGTTEMYKRIGNGSPILRITESLAQKITQYLEGEDIRPFVTMRYTQPRAVEVVNELKNQKIEHIILFSQYPHFADSTTGSSLKEFYNAMEMVEYRPQTVIEIDEWGLEPEYIDWWVDGIKEIINTHKIELNKSVHLIFSAHGLPKRYVDKGEKYPDRIKEAANTILTKLGQISELTTTHISFQSQAGPVEWTKPYTDELLREISKKTDQTVIIVPLGFVSNHVETLYEIDILYKEEAERHGISRYYRVEVPDDHDRYAQEIANFLRRKMEAD